MLEPFKALIDWKSVDWEEGSFQLALKLVVDVEEVVKQRMLHAPETRNKATRKIPWENINWELPVSRLVELTGANPTTVYHFKRIYAPYRKRRANIDWKSVDWTKSSREIAEKLGVGVPRVCRNRCRHVDRPKGYRILIGGVTHIIRKVDVHTDTRFEATYRNYDMLIYLDQDNFPEGRFYIRVENSEISFGTAYDGWASEGATTMDAAIRDAIIGSGLQNKRIKRNV